jgi:hypothetical protein
MIRLTPLSLMPYRSASLRFDVPAVKAAMSLSWSASESLSPTRHWLEVWVERTLKAVPLVCSCACRSCVTALTSASARSLRFE